MALNIVYIHFEEGSPKLHYQGEVYSPEEFSLCVPVVDYNYIVKDTRQIGRAKEIILNLDECFERLLKGGDCDAFLF